MDDLISRKALLKEYEWLMTQTSDCNKPVLQEHIDRINRQPAVDAEPVRHGKWLKPSGMLPPECHDKKRCSVCGNFALHDRLGRVIASNYCPNCGAKMEEV